MTDEEIEARLADGSRQFKALNDNMEAVLRALEPIPRMQADIADAKADSATVKELVEAWSAVKTGGKFVRWIAPIFASVAAAWAAMKLGVAYFLGR